MIKKISKYLIVLLVVNTACKKECETKPPCYDHSNPNCENYDPCYNQFPVGADFIVGINVSGIKFKDYNLPYIEDSVFSQRSILNYLTLYFAAKERNANYHWQLGSELIEDSIYSRDFRAVPHGKYSVNLIVDKQPNSICFPNDDGKDTLTKYFWIKPVYETPIVGKFKVLFEGETDSSIVQIKPWQSIDNINWPVKDTMNAFEIVFINFDNSNDTLKSYQILGNSIWTGSNIYFVKDETTNTNATWHTCSNGYVKILNQDEIVATYTYLRKKRAFKGRRM